MIAGGAPIVGSVHVRRALLLFAIVLGLAALTASLSRPREEDPLKPQTAPSSEPTTPRASPAPAPSPPEELAFDAAEDDVLELDEGARRSR